MKKLSWAGVAAAIGGAAVSAVAGAGVASATPDLGPAINTTCTYPQLVNALNAQDPQVGAFFNQSPQLKAGLQVFLVSGPAQRERMAQQLVSAPAVQPYLGSVEQAFLTCHQF
ncbi:hemophore-related protein [Mycolicibacterium agri]|uniref:Hemophore-related protein n=1 Tax=Mycolicibacterium agri TaxID=36811 RepID=A0A2A7MP26_MYCAG|nr:hemophore-related protein [Mycolicibacterium agri]PEG33329.1 hemophore-related protein [Mycolicibacterium agri]GFG50538.1 hypothetical protein MAGR_19790 [Mycolicibacterium agri]